MFGNNPLEKRTNTPNELDVVSVWHTLQGEGPFAGQPAVFVRLAGCHLHCWFCDTDFTSERAMHNVHDVVRLVGNVAARGTRLVVLTGGEPMRQNITKLIVSLCTENYRVQIETAGSFRPGDGDLPTWETLIESQRLSIVVSPKTPKVDAWIQRWALAYKYIVPAEGVDEYGLPTINTQVRGGVRVAADMPPPFTRVYLQPMDYGYGNDAFTLAARRNAVEACLKHGHHLSVQVHKIVGVA